MELNFGLELATLVAACVAGLIASGTASHLPRKAAGGGTVAPLYKWLPFALYFAPVSAEHKFRRALLDVSTVVTTLTVASLSDTWAFVPWSFVWAALVAASHTDLRTQRLPHRLTALNAVASVVFAVTLLGFGDLGGALIAIGCGATLSLFYFIIGLITYGKIGMGDVYLAIGTGTLAGTFGGFFGLILSFIGTAFASLVGLVVLAVITRGRLSKGTKIPFGPYIAIGALLVVAAGLIATNSPFDDSTMIGDILSRLAVES